MAVRKGKAAAPEKSTDPSALTPRPPRKVPAPSAGDVPATCAMLAEVRTELLLRMDGLENRLMGEIHGVKAEVHGLKAEVQGVKADVARIGFLIEEQNARNKVVLDALVTFMDRQDRTEQRMDGVEQTVRSLASPRAPT